MRIALCFSGYPRCYKEASQYLKKNIINQYGLDDVDVFFHSWTDVGKHVLSDIADTYSVRRWDHCWQFRKEKLLRYPDAHPDWPAKNAYHMFYSIMKANQIRKEYELTHNVEYDVVIRSRFDFCLNRKLDFSIMKKGIVYVPNDYIKGHIKPNGIICNDQFAYGDPYTMDLYSNTFWNIDRASSLGCPMIGEDLLSVNLQISGLINEKLAYIDMNHPFPPGKYNNTPHSLLREELL